MKTQCSTCIHSRNCINGKYCTDRKVYVEHHKARKMAQPQIDRLQANLDLIKQYYMGETKPMLDYLHKAEKQVVEHYIFMYGFSKERAEIVVGIAVNKVLDRLQEGFPNPHIKGMIFRYARNESNRLMRQKELFDERQVIEIE